MGGSIGQFVDEAIQRSIHRSIDSLIAQYIHRSIVQDEREDDTTAVLAETFAAKPKKGAMPQKKLTVEAKEELPPPPPPPPRPVRPVSPPHPPRTAGSSSNRPKAKVQIAEKVGINQDPADTTDSIPPYDDVDFDDASPDDAAERKTLWKMLEPVPPATSQEQQELVKEEEQEQEQVEEDQQQDDPASDPEDERQQCEAIIADMDKLVAVEELREKRKAMAEGAQVGKSRLHLLTMVRDLMQRHVTGAEATASDDPEASAKKAKLDDQEAKNSAKSQEVKDEATQSDGQNADAGMDDCLAVPQARAFMASQGYDSFDSIVDGWTLIHHCCVESANRNMSGVCLL